MEYPYFKGLEADRYSFYRVPKALVKADLFQKMSGDAKLLYAVLLDRMSLSIKNGWQDKHGEPMNFTDNPFERMMRQRPGTDSGHPCKHCRHKWECGYLLHQCRKKFRSVLGDTAPPAAGAVRP